VRQDSLERAVRAAGITATPRFLDETPSTNTTALELADEGAPEWTVVAAGHQTAGRGRLGRSWVDAPGKALAVSVVLRPAIAPDEAPLISLLAGWAMVVATSLPRARAKWPNDLLAGDRKLGGILAEARMSGGSVDHVVLGAGVNVAMVTEEFPPELRSGATSLAIEGGDTDDAGLLARFLTTMKRAWPPDGPEVVARYREVCDTLGRRVRATTSSGAVVEGTATEISSTGGLVVDGHTISFAEVTHLG
jgi:BirA family biotin operon repressor/biotin-[acetyl-CoA-carboxylase] ligase